MPACRKAPPTCAEDFGELACSTKAIFARLWAFTRTIEGIRDQTWKDRQALVTGEYAPVKVTPSVEEIPVDTLPISKQAIKQSNRDEHIVHQEQQPVVATQRFL